MPQFARLSFSLIYKEEKDTEPRTLDLTCKNEQEFTLWFWGIQVSPAHNALHDRQLMHPLVLLPCTLLDHQQVYPLVLFLQCSGQPCTECIA